MITIRLAGINFEGRHGVTADERVGSRRFEVDVEIDAPVEKSERSDRLADTIDYSAVAEIVVAIGTGEPHHLIESLGRRMLDALAEKFPETRLRLELRKMTPPGCKGHPAYAAVRLSHPHG